MQSLYVDRGLIPNWAISTKTDNVFGIPHDKIDSIQSELLLAPLQKRSGMSAPNLIIGEHEGRKNVVASLEWGKKLCRVRIESPPKENFADALSFIFSLARGIPLEDSIDFNAKIEELMTIKRDRGGPKFENIVPLGKPQFVCSIKCEGSIYRSKACSSKMDALCDLSVILNNLPVPLQKLPINKPLSPALKTDHLVSEHCKKKIPKADTQLLLMAAERWKREHRWLLSKSSQSIKDELRISQLSRFLAIADPLRKYEVSGAMRAETVKAMAEELVLHKSRASASEYRKLLGIYLRKMVITSEMNPGDEVCVSQEFKDSVWGNGDDPDQVISKLSDEGFLRLRQGKLLLSNRGITLIEEALKAPYGINTIGSVVSPEMIFALSSTR